MTMKINHRCKLSILRCNRYIILQFSCAKEVEWWNEITPWKNSESKPCNKSLFKSTDLHLDFNIKMTEEYQDEGTDIVIICSLILMKYFQMLIIWTIWLKTKIQWILIMMQHENDEYDDYVLCIIYHILLFFLSYSLTRKNILNPSPVVHILVNVHSHSMEHLVWFNRIININYVRQQKILKRKYVSINISIPNMVLLVKFPVVSFERSSITKIQWKRNSSHPFMIIHQLSSILFTKSNVL